MISVLVCTHGNAAEELIKAAEMICGKQEECDSAYFHLGESLNDLKERLEEKINTLKGPIVCLTDLKGGTPFNILVTLSKTHPEIEIITGVNMPMMVQLFIYRSLLPKNELISSIINNGKNGIYAYGQDVLNDEDF